MGAVSIQQMADRVAQMMEERLGAKGQGLDAKLKSAGRRLPRRVRSGAEALAAASAMSQNPKLLLQIDEGTVADAYDICLRHLGGQPKLTGRSAFLNGLRSLLFSLAVLGLLIFGILMWRGFL